MRDEIVLECVGENDAGGVAADDGGVEIFIAEGAFFLEVATEAKSRLELDEDAVFFLDSV